MGPDGGRRDAASAPSTGDPAGSARSRSAAASPGLARSAAAPARSPQQPAALLYGPAHKIVHANAAFVAEFGLMPIGVPAAEALLDLPPIVLQVVERAIAERRPLATWVDVNGTRRRLTVAPRADIETGEIYGVALGLASIPGRDSPAGP